MQIPQDFYDLIDSYGAPQLRSLRKSLSDEPCISVRYNSIKGCHAPEGSDLVAWCRQGRYLQEREAFTFDPSMHQGCYYVQDASSMFIGHVVTYLTSGRGAVRYLDACAAPGGKTTAAIDALPFGSLVTANEYAASRAAVLRENVVKWGYPYVAVTQGDTSRFRFCRGQFDIIAADVPCSGEGMMRKDASAVTQWNRKLVESCAATQRKIIDDLWPALMPGGYLIYSTCTFNRTENEDIVSHIMAKYGARSVSIPTCPSWGIASAIAGDAVCYRFIPGSVRGEGLFMAVLQKPDDEVSASNERRNGKRRESRGALSDAAIKTVAEWLDPSADIAVERRGDVIVAGKKYLPAGFDFLPFSEVAAVRGRDIVPTQALAMSILLRSDAFFSYEVDYDTAIDYLSHKALTLDTSAKLGTILLTYLHRPLGFVKNVGNRANNLYPSQWRILSQHRPASAPSVMGG